MHSSNTWQLWQLASKGSGYCALATASLASLPPQMQAMAQGIAASLVPRDRYSALKTALLVHVTLELRDEERPEAERSAVGRALHYLYAPWSSRVPKYRHVDYTNPVGYRKSVAQGSAGRPA
ncbi:hypothetical protein AB4156_29830 [Cupriavidus sp. 2MCAB6]|uniref:hypothetical protein n=1 Tax=Cupriavidus sp. 2MCAB6 TaxID=3232981 RepID=UPI003F8EEC3F